MTTTNTIIHIDDLIDALTNLRKEHDNLTCQVWIRSEAGDEMTSEGMPTFEIFSDGKGVPESIAIDFDGSVQDTAEEKEA